MIMAVCKADCSAVLVAGLSAVAWRVSVVCSCELVFTGRDVSRYTILTPVLEFSALGGCAVLDCAVGLSRGSGEASQCTSNKTAPIETIKTVR